MPNTQNGVFVGWNVIWGRSDVGASSFSTSSGHQRYSSLIEVKKQKGLQKSERGPKVLHEQWTSIKATVSLISLIGWIFLTWFVLGFCVFFWELVSCYNGKALWQTLPSPPLTTSISWMASSDSPGHPRKYFRIPVNFQKLPEISHNCWLANWNSLVSSQVELKLNFFLFLRLSLWNKLKVSRTRVTCSFGTKNLWPAKMLIC